MGEEKDSIKKLEKKISSLENTVETQKNEIAKLGDPANSPRVILRGNQKHPKYQKNKIRVSPVMAAPIPETK